MALVSVIGTRAEDEMIGVHAASDVAAMADDHASGNRAVLRRPGEPVSLLMAASVTETAVAVHNRAAPDVAAGQKLGLAVVG